MKTKILIWLLPFCLSINAAFAEQTLQVIDNSNSTYLASQNITNISYYISNASSGSPLENIRVGCGSPGKTFTIPIPADAALNTNYYIVAFNCTSGASNTFATYDNSVMFTLMNHTSNLRATCGLQDYSGIKLICSAPAQ
jgi:hypothetical protein